MRTNQVAVAPTIPRAAAWEDLGLVLDPNGLLFPDLSPAQYAALKADVKMHGLREPIWLTRNGALLDGRHRKRACNELGIKCPTRVYTGDNPTAFVTSLNLHRRHLTTRERAEIAARIATLVRGTNQYKVKRMDASNDASSKKSRTGTSIKEAAKLMKVSAMSVTRAKVRLRPKQAPVSHAAKRTASDERLSMTLLARPQKPAAPPPLLERERALRRAVAQVRVQYPYEERGQFIRLLLEIVDNWDSHARGGIPLAEWRDPTRT
jgi:ParB-like chromosome segregation protein Spo0J